jgi:thiamine-phosphate pyrophosphorylase
MRELDMLGLSIPIYAIGGIVRSDVALLKRIGVYGIAVSGMISASDERAHMVSEIEKVLE